jgi:hypothetical protein
MEYIFSLRCEPLAPLMVELMFSMKQIDAPHYAEALLCS